MSKIWDMRFLELAISVSEWSKDPSTKVGCVVVEPDTKTILATGYNGFPRGIDDTAGRLQNRTFKLRATAHAEVNAIYAAARFGHSLLGATLYSTFMPCCGVSSLDEEYVFTPCAPAIIQSGIKRVVIYDTKIPERWQKSMKMSEQLFAEAGIELDKIRM